MKVLYIGHYKEFGGWGQAATDQILALDSVGIDVVCRNITLTRDKDDVHQRILDLEAKTTEGCNYCIQHVLPHHLVGSTGFKKNIAFLEIEIDSIKHLAWFNHLQMMDEIWVPNTSALEALTKDNINVPIKIVPHSCDISKYTKNYKEIDIPEARGKFKFYYIGDINDRKNIESIITCFHSEFEPSEDVSLILKVKKFGYTKEKSRQFVDHMSTSIKASIRMFTDMNKYRKDILITEDASDEQIIALHKYADCFICPSHGEAWSIPSFDAMAFGNTPICSNYGGPKEFINNEDPRTGTLIDGVYSVCKCQDAAFPDLFTGREFWFQPCERQIRTAMRKYYDEWKSDKITYKSKNMASGFIKAKQFSYENIGKKMKEELNE